MKTTSTVERLCKSDCGIVKLLIVISLVAIIAACVVPVSVNRSRNGRLLEQPGATKQIPETKMIVRDKAAGDRSTGATSGTGEYSDEDQSGATKPLNSSEAGRPAKARGSGWLVSF